MVCSDETAPPPFVQPQIKLALFSGGGMVAEMKPTLIALLALGLCLTLGGAEKKKTDVEKDGYKGRVKFRSLFRRSGLNSMIPEN